MNLKQKRTEQVLAANLKALAARGIDGLGHSAVQPWSAGPLFPCVIAKVERYADAGLLNGILTLEERLETQWWELTLDGRTEQYATCEDAEMVAKALLESPRLRARWSRRELQRMDDCVCGTSDAEAQS